MQTHDQLVKKLLRRPGVKAEVERIEREEGNLLDALLKARQGVGLTQAQVAANGNTCAGRGAPGAFIGNRENTLHRLQPCGVMSKPTAGGWCFA